MFFLITEDFWMNNWGTGGPSIPSVVIAGHSKNVIAAINVEAPPDPISQIVGGLSPAVVTSTSRDVRITGQATSSDTRDVRITGVAPSIPYIAFAGATLNIAKANSPFEYDQRELYSRFWTSRLPSVSSIAFDVRITGQNASSSTQDVRISAHQPSYVIIAGQTKGVLRAIESFAYDQRELNSRFTARLSRISFNDTDVRITGQATSSDTRDVRITGQDTSSDTRDVRITGTTLIPYVAVAGQTRTVLRAISAFEYEQRELYSRFTARLSRPTVDTRDVRITGQDTSAQAQDVRITGQATLADTRDVRITGQLPIPSLVIAGHTKDVIRPIDKFEYEQRELYSRVFARLTRTVADSRDVRITGQLTSSVAYDVRTTATLGSNVAYDVRVTGQAASSTAYDVRVTGQLTTSDTRDARLTAQADSSDTRDVRVIGQLTLSSAQDVRLTAQSDSNQAFDIRTIGTNVSATSYNARITAPGGTFDEHDARVTGRDTASASYDVRLFGVLSASADFNIRVRGAALTNLSQDVRFTGKSAPTFANYNVKLIAQAFSNTLRDVRVAVSSVPFTTKSVDVRINAVQKIIPGPSSAGIIVNRERAGLTENPSLAGIIQNRERTQIN